MAVLMKDWKVSPTPTRQHGRVAGRSSHPSVSEGWRVTFTRVPISRRHRPRVHFLKARTQAHGLVVLPTGSGKSLVIRTS